MLTEHGNDRVTLESFSRFFPHESLHARSRRDEQGLVAPNCACDHRWSLSEVAYYSRWYPGSEQACKLRVIDQPDLRAVKQFHISNVTSETNGYLLSILGVFWQAFLCQTRVNVHPVRGASE